MNTDNSASLTIGFTGDLAFSGYFADCCGDDTLLGDGIKNFLNANDYNVINFESPVTPCRITKKKRLAHRSSPEALDFVKRNIKNPVLSFANNHMMDFGTVGVVDTIDSCKASGVPFIGIGMNVSEAARCVILGNGIKVGLLSVQYKHYRVATAQSGGPLHESRIDYIKAAIKSLRPKVDYVVLVYHGGDEFLHLPSAKVRHQFKKYLRWGCDAVVAHHPHVVQGYEYFGTKPVFYSLGNFVFDTDYQRAQNDTDKGMLLRLKFTKSGIAFEALPTHIDRENKKVSVGDDMSYFTDVKKLPAAVRKQEKLRRLDVIARTKAHKEQELQTREEKHAKEQVRIEQMEARAAIKEALSDKTDPELAGRHFGDDNHGNPDEGHMERRLGAKDRI